MSSLLQLSPQRRRAITGALLVGTLLSSMEVMVVGPAMPAVVSELGQAGLFPWVFTAHILMSTIATPVTGFLADRAGRAWLYAVAVALFLLGSAACAMAPTMPAMVAARAVQGVGGGALITLTLTLFGDLYPAAQRTKVQGLFSIVWGVSALVGPALGGYITDTWSWRGIFWIGLPPGIVAAAVVLYLLPRGRHQAHEPLSLWRGIRTLLGDPTQQAVAGSGLLLGAALTGVLAYLPVWVRAVKHGSAMDAGIALLPLSLAWTLGANVAGRLVQRLGFQVLVRTGTGLVCLGTMINAFYPANQPGLLLFGLGMGFTISSFTVSSQEAAPQSLRGAATSLALLSRSLGSAAGVPLFGLLAGFQPGAGDFDDIPGLDLGIVHVFYAVGAAAMVGAAIVALRFPRHHGLIHEEARRGPSPAAPPDP